MCNGFFRGCDNELTSDEKTQGRKFCSQCRLKKSGKSYDCQFKDCKFKIEKKEDKYCNKHIRELLRDNEKEKNIQYCDISRGCFNILTDDIKCIECRNKEKNKVATELFNLRNLHNIKLPQRNESDALFEKQESGGSDIKETWRNIQRNAILRKILFTLTQQEFEQLVIQPCYYCGFYSNYKINGIDRIDNNKGYVIDNCIPSCKMCNMIKGVNHPLAFLDKVKIICAYRQSPKPITNREDVKWETYLTFGKSKSYNDYKILVKNRTKEIQFLISDADYNTLIQGECYLCGVHPMEGHRNGIDRYDNSGHYTIENCRTCCGYCNLMKRDYLYNDFMCKCIQIMSYNCNTQRFTSVPVVNAKTQKLRNEYYTADDIAKILQEGHLTQFLEWCEEKGKTIEFTSAITNIASKLNDDIVEQLKKELENERSRKSYHTNQPEKKHIQSTSLYSYLSTQKHDEFVEWYSSIYDKTSLFDEKFKDLKDAILTHNKEDGIKLCKKFLYDEKSRRNSQKMRDEKSRNVIVYTPPPQKETPPPKSPVIKVKNAIVQQDPPPKDTVVEKILERKSFISTQTPAAPKQWKVADVYSFIKQGNENVYYEYLKQNNPIQDNPDFEDRWITFVLHVKHTSLQQDAEHSIKDFILWLRNIRHNILCANTNAKKVLEKEDRQHYRADGILTLFKTNNQEEIAKFKSYTENYAGDSPSDPKWVRRWTDFVTQVDNESTDEGKKRYISKFLMAQRKKKNDRKV